MDSGVKWAKKLLYSKNDNKAVKLRLAPQQDACKALMRSLERAAGHMVCNQVTNDHGLRRLGRSGESSK